jgi:Domain of unknown function (DUF4272)
MEDEYTEPNPPTPEKVARRAVILSVIACRGITDKQVDNGGAGHIATKSKDWLQSLNLEEEMSAWEKAVVFSPLSSLTDRDRINASWLSEAVAVLAWALGRIEMPAFDEMCDPQQCQTALDFYSPLRIPCLHHHPCGTRQNSIPTTILFTTCIGGSGIIPSFKKHMILNLSHKKHGEVRFYDTA